jgi:molybdenum cofactor cytidylyltransferase
MAADTSPTHHEATPSTVVVILAAGEGRRFHGDDHKLLADIDGRSVVAHAIDHALDAGIGPVVVVTGAVALDPVETALLDRVTVVHNPDWANGQSTSVQTGLRAAEQLGADAVVIGLGDQPGVPAEAWRRVAGAASPIAVATYGGARRNPVRLHRSVWPLVPTDGDSGARSVIRLRPELVEAIPCPGSAADIDTREDLQRWQNRSSTSSP